MNIEINQPELEQRFRSFIQSGRFHDTDELLREALDALEKTQPSTHDERTGADLITALQSSPLRELEIEPARFPLPVRDFAL